VDFKVHETLAFQEWIWTRRKCKTQNLHIVVYLKKKFYNFFRTNTLRFIYLGIVTMVWIALSSLYINFKNRKLMYKAWLPFDYYSSTVLFYLTSAHQVISLTIAMFVNIGCDTLICGLLVHICCQIEILTYRLRNIIFCSDFLRVCLYQHYHIFRLNLVILNVDIRIH